MQIDQLKDILEKYIPKKKSPGKVTLSVGEGLLLVIDACKSAMVDKTVMNELHRLYLEGVKTKEDREFISGMENILANKKYLVSSDPKVINEDPTRRYFETNLSFYLIQNNAESLNHFQLRKFTQNLKHRLFSLPGADRKERQRVEKMLHGEMDDKVLNKYELEYAELIGKLLQNNFYGLSEKACKNLYEIACCTILSTLNTQVDKSMPVDVYSDSVFSMGMDGRGRIMKPSNQQVKTTAKGLMNSFSPLPMYHDVVNPVEENYDNGDAYSPIQRSADQAGFMIESQWGEHLFSRLTQPYSNGISSTTLAQIRNIILQKRLGNFHPSEENFQKYMTAFAGLMLYNSGGHSFFEIFEVFKLPLCRELFEDESHSENSQVPDDLMYKWLCKDQPEAFKQALEATQIYMRTLLNKKMLNAELIENNKRGNSINGFNEPTLAKASTLHQAIISSDMVEFERLLQDKSSINQENHKKWTPLMVASQLGKVEFVNKLLQSGADVTKKVDDQTALELAVKARKFAVVSVLLNDEKAKVKINSLGNLKKRAPALYLACRQNDLRILTAVLESGKNKLSSADKKEALKTALQMENLDALKVIIESMSIKDKNAIFTEKYKSELLQEAVSLGNVQLITKLLTLDVGFTKIDYAKLLNITAERGFFPVAKNLIELFYVEKNPLNSQMTQSLLNLNKALLSALEHNHFDLALLYIIHGADPAAIGSNANYIRDFDKYLQYASSMSYFQLVDIDESIISARAKEISNTLEQRKSSVLNLNFLQHLTDFLNSILPNCWRLGYNDKTSAISNMAQLFSGSTLATQSSRNILIPEDPTRAQGQYQPNFFGSIRNTPSDTLLEQNFELNKK